MMGSYEFGGLLGTRVPKLLAQRDRYAHSPLPTRQTDSGELLISGTVCAWLAWACEETFRGRSENDHEQCQLASSRNGRYL